MGLLGLSATGVVIAGPSSAQAATGSATSSTTSSGTSTGTGAVTSVMVTFAAPHPHRLRALAQRRGIDRRERAARVARLLPSPAVRRHAARSLRARGFTITQQTPWSLTATASAAAVRDAFGARPTSPTASYATTPAFLGDGVDAVLPSSAAAGEVMPLNTVLSGSDFRSAYSGGTSSGQSLTGQSASSRTIATLQFSSYNTSDITNYATANGLAQPNLTRVDVGTTNTDTSGSVEVALDQESILSTAPTAKQRVYVATNSSDNWVPLLNRIRTDAASDTSIVALSISWGMCETGSRGTVNSAFATNIDNALASLSAAGVTIFAASGDSGLYCPTTGGTSVTLPASSPNVVAVGGTTLTRTGSNWLDSTWSCASAQTCLSNGGAGGGQSVLFARPTWQTNTLSGSYAAGSNRLVPDISAIGDPSTGFRVLNQGAWGTYGGTSLSAPVAASLFTDALAESSISSSTRPGDIHQALYGSYQTSRSSVFRDVTSGQIGAAADSSLPTCAGDGYDVASGLGAVQWPALIARLGQTTTDAPVATAATSCPVAATTTSTTTTSTPGPTAHVTVTVGRHRGHRARVFASWSTVARSTLGLATTRVVVTDLTSHRVLLRTSGQTGVRSVLARVGHRLRVVVTPRDVAGKGTSVSTTRRVR
ncbi:hypothetical protein D9V37_04125 [Nocardioides mangrovicus]|uniref:Peptidase S53 domain-containing protein n=1 Tax=Nocardioides mangrovicus TaxID=2478913 RepID=A0A3L8P8B9_9ACTN|nr:hypothetical protein D9V37_04125 [Nocardioides mangrovicus]